MNRWGRSRRAGVSPARSAPATDDTRINSETVETDVHVALRNRIGLFESAEGESAGHDGLRDLAALLLNRPATYAKSTSSVSA